MLKSLVLVCALTLSLPLWSQLPARGSWTTDLSKKSINLSDLISGGPPKDGIPSVDNPKFIPQKAASWLSPKELVLSIAIHGEARAYPLQILMWHELVNDTVAGEPILASYCPLCNSGIIFSRKVDGKVLEFGVSGMLRNSDMVMYDRQTDSLWQQITGEGIVGGYTGSTLRMLPAQMIPFDAFRASYPDGLVLSRDTGFQRDYGRNPYRGYEWGSGPIMPMSRKTSSALNGMEKLVVVSDRKGYRAYPFSYLKKGPVVEDKAAGENIVVFFTPEGLSPVDAVDMSKSRATGAVGVFSPVVEGKRLRFRSKGNTIVDKETGSRWLVTGEAVEGTLKGKRLNPVEHGVYFTFAWLAFQPQTFVYGVPLSSPSDGLEPPSREGGSGAWLCP